VGQMGQTVKSNNISYFPVPSLSQVVPGWDKIGTKGYLEKS